MLVYAAGRQSPGERSEVALSTCDGIKRQQALGITWKSRIFEKVLWGKKSPKHLQTKPGEADSKHKEFQTQTRGPQDDDGWWRWVGGCLKLKPFNSSSISSPPQEDRTHARLILPFYPKLFQATVSQQEVFPFPTRPDRTTPDPLVRGRGGERRVRRRGGACFTPLRRCR